MTFEQTSQIMEVLETAYPQFYSGKYAPDRKKALALWAKMFAGDDVKLVSAAVYAIIKTDKGGFPPSIGDITDKMQELTARGSEMTEMEAWGLVQKALRNSAYNSAEEYHKLPPLVQRLVGSPSQLRDWAMLDANDVQTVVASNFQRSYRARAKSEREYSKLPECVKDFVASIADGMQMERLPAGNAGQGDMGAMEREALKRMTGAGK